MSKSSLAHAANGGRDLGLRIAVVIDDNVLRQLSARSVLRESSLFSLIISCESSEIAREVIDGDDAPLVLMYLVDAAMADECLAFMSPAKLARTAIMHDAEETPDTELLALPRPLTVAVIEDIVSRFDQTP